MEERLRLGVSYRDLAQGMSKIAGLNYLGDYSHDNIDVGHIMKGLCKQPSSPAAVIINSGNQQRKGEHWEAIYISPTGLTNKSSVEFFDSYGLPPIQDGTSKLLGLLSQKDWVCNHQPVQDIMDITSRACGQHCLYYIMNRYHKPELNLEDLIQCIYHKSDLMILWLLLNKKHISNKTKRHTNKDPGKTIYFPCSKKQSPDQTKSRAHQIMLR